MTRVPALAEAEIFLAMPGQLRPKSGRTPHAAMVAELVARGCEVRAFRPKLRAALLAYFRDDDADRPAEHVRDPHAEEDDDDESVDVEAVVEEILPRQRITPDAFRILPEEQAVAIFEVEDTHPLKPGKIAIYSALWWALDFYGWDLAVFAVGVRGVVYAVDLAAVGLNRIARAAGAP